LFENKAFFNNFLPIDRSLIDNDLKNFDVNNLEIMLTAFSSFQSPVGTKKTVLLSFVIYVMYLEHA